MWVRFCTSHEVYSNCLPQKSYCYNVLLGDFGEDQLVHQVVETILTATATKATEEPPPHEPDSVATSNTNSKFVICHHSIL